MIDQEGGRRELKRNPSFSSILLFFFQSVVYYHGISTQGSVKPLQETGESCIRTCLSELP